MKRPASYTEQVTEEARQAPARRRGPGRKWGETWDTRNPATPFRLRPEDRERLDRIAAELGLSRDALGAALVWAGLDALEEGRLELEIETATHETTDRRGRTRIYTRRQARPRGQISPSRSDSITDGDKTKRSTLIE
jgi:hypothetical protein